MAAVETNFAETIATLHTDIRRYDGARKILSHRLFESYNTHIRRLVPGVEIAESGAEIFPLENIRVIPFAYDDNSTDTHAYHHLNHVVAYNFRDERDDADCGGELFISFDHSVERCFIRVNTDGVSARIRNKCVVCARGTVIEIIPILSEELFTVDVVLHKVNGEYRRFHAAKVIHIGFNAPSICHLSFHDAPYVGKLAETLVELRVLCQTDRASTTHKLLDWVCAQSPHWVHQHVSRLLASMFN